MINISNNNIDIDTLKKIIFDDEKISLSSELMESVEKSYNFLIEFSKDKVIYGVNTGLGPMAQYKIEEKEQVELQYNLIRSHAAGLGNHLNYHYTKAALIARLKSLSLAYSGVHKDLLKTLENFINNNIQPYIPEHGGVGASGDLVQLAHLALNIIGEGEVFYNNEKYDTKTLLNKLNIPAFKIRMREGLALINGTSVMTGIGIVNLLKAKKLLSIAILTSSIINEIVNSFDDHFSDTLNKTKQHSGQLFVAQKMQNILSDSKLISKRDDIFYNKEKIKDKVFSRKVQEYYSLRCVPQILGPIYETISNAEKILIEEINSVNDNPIIDYRTNNIYHGGNFHGDYISFEMDKLKIAVTKLTMLIERQLNYLLNHKLNEILPPFVNLGKLGFNLGMQGTQFTATSTTAENQTLSNPMYIHSIPNNNDNQDIVSMGTNSALIAAKVIDNSFQVMSIYSLTLVQAVDYLKIKTKLSSETKLFYDNIREIVPVFENDNIKYTELNNIKNHLTQI